MCDNRISPNTVLLGILLVSLMVVSYATLQRSNELEKIRSEEFLVVAKSCRERGHNEVELADTFNYCLKMKNNQTYCADVVRSQTDAIAYACLVSELKRDL